MEKTFALRPYGPHLWTRERAREIRASLEAAFAELATGDMLVIDLDGVEVFDFSFANELFGRTLLSLPAEHPGRFVLVDHLNPYTRENLSEALTSLGLVMIERREGALDLLGKVHPADGATFKALVQAGRPAAAAELAESLGINLTAANERLSKLVRLAVVARWKATSAAGREQYLYSVPS